MRAIVVAAALAGALLSVLFSGPFPELGAEAFAQSSAAYPYCLMTGPAQSCAYNSMAQCLAAKRGSADFCEPNNWYSDQAERYRFRQ